MKMIRGVATIEGDTHIGKWVQEQGTLNIAKGMLDPLRSWIPRGGCVVDAGANIGDHSYYYAHAVGEGGSVLAFEPNSEAFACLQYNMVRNQLTGIVDTKMLGLSDSAGKTTLHPEQNAGARWMHTAPVDGGAEVVFDKLDSFLLSRLDFLKIDIEGWELRALKGASNTISQFHPAMLIEVNSGALNRAGTSREELLEYISGLGYQWKIHGGGVHTDPQFDVFCV